MGVIKGKTNSGLVKYAIAQLGLPYWYGTFGQIATESLHKSKAKQYASTGYYTKWNDYPKQYGKRVHDCVGLVKGYLWSSSPTAVPKYNALQDKSACSMFLASSIRGTISSFPARPGMLVYKSYDKNDPKQIHHVGVFIGGGYVVEAKGHEEGVVQTKFEGAGWTHWSQCPYIEDDAKTEPKSYAKDREGQFCATGRVYIRSGAGKANRSLGVIKKGETVYCEGCFTRVDGTEWLEVNANLGGRLTEGWVSGKYLKKV